jgi:hypothetical protein
MHSLLLRGPIAVVLLLAGIVSSGGCAADGADGADGEDDLEANESELGTLEYQRAQTWYGGMPRLNPDIAHPDGYGWGGFDSAGDGFYLGDTRGDGRSVGIHWVRGTRQGLCVLSSGSGTEGACGNTFPNDVSIKLRVGRCDGSRVDCHKLRNWTNWTVFTGGYT